MRLSLFLAAAALVAACAPPHVPTPAPQPKVGDLTVQMLAPERDAVRYRLSEPAYVAVFAITPGSRIDLVLPDEESATALPRPAGLNRQNMADRIPLTVVSPWHTQGRMQRLPTYYVLASRYPLAMEELLVAANSNSPLPTSVREATEVITDALTGGVAAGAWDADLFRYPFNPSTAASRRGGDYPTCEERAFNRTTLMVVTGCQTRQF